MIDRGKYNLLGVGIDAVDYDAAVLRIIRSAQNEEVCLTSALAVHGLITAALDRVHRFRLNSFQLLVPDGQPVKWALNSLHATSLTDRVYGPTLMLRVCEEASRTGLPVYFYGSSETVVRQLCARLRERWPNLRIAGYQPSRFRHLTEEERAATVQEIRAAGTRILLVGLGCPRQEVFAYEIASYLRMPILSVGAAFDYHAGILQEPPQLLQRLGFQWLYRLIQEPRRLWKRYFVTNTQFIILFLLQRLGLWAPDLHDTEIPEKDVLYG